VLVTLTKLSYVDPGYYWDWYSDTSGNCSWSGAVASQTERAYSLQTVGWAGAHRFWPITKQPYAAQVCRLMFSVTVIHVITWITAHLLTQKVWKAELATLVITFGGSIPEMNYYVSGGTLNPTHSPTFGSLRPTQPGHSSVGIYAVHWILYMASDRWGRNGEFCVAAGPVTKSVRTLDYCTLYKSVYYYYYYLLALIGSKRCRLFLYRMMIVFCNLPFHII